MSDLGHRNGSVVAVRFESRTDVVAEQRKAQERWRQWVAQGHVIAHDMTSIGDAAHAYELDQARREIVRLRAECDDLRQRCEQRVMPPLAAEHEELKNLHRGPTRIVRVTLNGGGPFLAPSRVTGSRLRELLQVASDVELRGPEGRLVDSGTELLGLIDGDAFVTSTRSAA